MAKRLSNLLMGNLVTAPLIAAAILVGWVGTAQAGGYDTPMLYSARHMGMGGTAVGYVDDPSALFHNPAGLGRVQNLSLLGDFSLLLGNIQASPENPAANMNADSIDSELTIAPFFLVGGAYRIPGTPVVAGLAVYPVASAGATFEYDSATGVPTTDSTSLVFIEVSPGVAVELPGRITLGASYRITYVSLSREKVAEGAAVPALDFAMTGLNFAGFRVGAQWEAVEDHLSIGLAYRHKTVTTVTNTEGVALAMPMTDIETDFTLPSRLSAGVRGDYGNFGAAIDFEYAFNSQNESSILKSAEIPGGVPNIFAWSDAITLRFGAEYTIETGHDALIEDGRGDLPLRLGFVWDQKTSNEAYPTAFGTPPAPTNVLTLGGGYDGGPWEVNAAYAYRFGSTTLPSPLPAGDSGSCAFCSHPGDYAIALHGIYVDFSYDIE